MCFQEIYISADEDCKLPEWQGLWLVHVWKEWEINKILVGMKHLYSSKPYQVIIL